MKYKVNAKLLIAAVLGFLLVSTTTYTLLSIFTPRDKTTQEAVSTGSTPKDIIDALRKPETIANISDSYSEVATSLASFNEINYTKANSYTISVPASDTIQYEQKDVQKSDNSESVVSSIESFLKQKGLSKVTATSATPSIYTIFEGDQTACQFVTLQKITTRPASLSVACVKKETITKAYETIDTLLALQAKASSTKLTPITIRSISVSEGNKTLTTLNVYISQDSATSLLFVAIDNSWEYLGDRPLSTGTTEDSPAGISRALSSELKAKIADPKYGDFLKKNII